MFVTQKHLVSQTGLLFGKGEGLSKKKGGRWTVCLPLSIRFQQSRSLEGSQLVKWKSSQACQDKSFSSEKRHPTHSLLSFQWRKASRLKCYWCCMSVTLISLGNTSIDRSDTNSSKFLLLPKSRIHCQESDGERYLILEAEKQPIKITC